MRAKHNNGVTTSGEPASSIDADLIRQLAELVGETGLAEIEIEKGDLRIRLTRQHSEPSYTAASVAPAPAALAPVATPAAVTAPAALDADHPGMVKSPMVGTVYRRQNPDAKPFVDVGSVVKAGDRVLLVEAMKTFNDIVAHKAGTVAAILIEDNQPVEFGEPLLLID